MSLHTWYMIIYFVYLDCKKGRCWGWVQCQFYWKIATKVRVVCCAVGCTSCKWWRSNASMADFIYLEFLIFLGRGSRWYTYRSSNWYSRKWRAFTETPSFVARNRCDRRTAGMSWNGTCISHNRRNTKYATEWRWSLNYSYNLCWTYF